MKILSERSEENRILEFLRELKKKENQKKPTYFVHFSPIFKLGIKPTGSVIKTAIDASENITRRLKVVFPYGVYGLPLKSVYSIRQNEEVFFGSRKFIFVFKPKSSSKILYFSDLPKPLETWKKWRDEAIKKYGDENPQASFTKYLRKDLGYDVIVDNIGNIMNYGNEILETEQAVFLNPSKIEVVKVFERFQTQEPDYGPETVIGNLSFSYNIKNFFETLRKYFKVIEINPKKGSEIIKFIAEFLNFKENFFQKYNKKFNTNFLNTLKFALKKNFPEYFSKMEIKEKEILIELEKFIYALKDLEFSEFKKGINELKNFLKKHDIFHDIKNIYEKSGNLNILSITRENLYELFK